MTIKDIFDKAENGTLTYAQFEAAMKAGNAKFADLSEGNYVSKSKYEDDLKVKDTQIETLNGTISTRDTDLANLKSQLETAGNDSVKLSELNTQLSTLQGQYETDMKEYQAKLSKQAYEFAVKEYANGQSFSSQAAKRDFVNAMLNRNLQMENDKIIGADDFRTSYQADNADAFKVEQEVHIEEHSTELPHFVQPSGNPNSGEESGPFSFSFMGVRPRK